MSHDIRLGPIFPKSEKQIRCPYCGCIIPSIFSEQDRYVGTMLTGEAITIPCLRDRLADRQKTPDGYYFGVTNNKLSCCGRDCFFVEVMFVNANVAENGSAFPWFEENLVCAPEEKVKTFLAEYGGMQRIVPARWHVQVTLTPKGLAHRHIFGPFNQKRFYAEAHCITACGCEASGIHDSWAFGSDLLSVLWDDLKGLTAP